MNFLPLSKLTGLVRHLCEEERTMNPQVRMWKCRYWLSATALAFVGSLLMTEPGLCARTFGIGNLALGEEMMTSEGLRLHQAKDDYCDARDRRERYRICETDTRLWKQTECSDFPKNVKARDEQDSQADDRQSGGAR